MNTKKILLNILIVIPFVLGFFAYLEFNPGDYLDAAYFALRNYILEYDFDDSSFLLELSRWSAILVTTSVVLSYLGKLLTQLKNRVILLLNNDLTAIYGAEEKIKYLTKSLDDDNKKYVILDKAVKTPKIKHHIAMFNTQEENLMFYSKNLDKFHKESHIHIWLEKFSPHLLNHDNIDFYQFSLAELTAQLFWKNDCTDLNKIALSKPVVKIAMVGSGAYIEKMLDYATQINLFDVNQKIEYHIFGDLDEYRNLHYKLAKTELEDRTELTIYHNDKLVFYKKKWHEHLEFFTSADKIIICEPCDTQVLNIACSLKSSIPITVPLYLQINDFSIIDGKIACGNNIVLFGDFYKVCNYKEITKNELIRLAKEQNDSYNTKNDVANYWENLDNFKRDSNIFSASFRNINSHILKDYKIDKQAELEHVRWSRFHYMYNWEFSTDKKDANGKPIKDELNRKHPSLVDYKDLPQSEKDKIIDAITSNQNA